MKDAKFCYVVILARRWHAKLKPKLELLEECLAKNMQ